LVGSTPFADPITITKNGQTMTVELINTERVQRLKELYESRYTYVYIMDSIEMNALFREDDPDEENVFYYIFFLIDSLYFFR